MKEIKDINILAIESFPVMKLRRQSCIMAEKYCPILFHPRLTFTNCMAEFVPEIASRKHIEKINQVIEEALKEADVTLEDIDAVAVTYGPGLVGALLVGVAEAKSDCICPAAAPLLVFITLRRHISANYIEHPDLEPPFFMSGRIRRTYSSCSCKRLWEI